MSKSSTQSAPIETIDVTLCRYFKAVAVTLVVFLVSSWSIAGIISLQHQYTHKVALPFESFDFLYDKPWQRVGAFIVGKSKPNP